MAVTLNEVSGVQMINLVLSQEHSFTSDELISAIQSMGMEVNEITLKRSLTRFCDMGIIIKQGSIYSISS